MGALDFALCSPCCHDLRPQRYPHFWLRSVIFMGCCAGLGGIVHASRAGPPCGGLTGIGRTKPIRCVFCRADFRIEILETRRLFSIPGEHEARREGVAKPRKLFRDWGIFDGLACDWHHRLKPVPGVSTFPDPTTILPERPACVSQQLVGAARSRSLQPTGDDRNGNSWKDQQMHVIGHDYPGLEFIEQSFLFASQDGLHDQSGDPRILQPHGTGAITF